MLQHLKNLDWLLAAAATTLVFFGLVSLYGSSGGDELLNFKKQVLWLAIGFFLMASISFFDYRILKNYTAPIVIFYAICLILLAGLLAFGATVRGTESWYKIGAITVEPVEFEKIAIILLLAKYFSMRHIEMYRIRHIIASGVYVLLPAILVILQREIGSVIVIISTWLGVMAVAGIKVKHLFLLGLLGAIIFLFSWNFLFHDYQRERLISFLNPASDPQGAGYNAMQSLIAVGSGGIWGKGLGQGTQTSLGFLPEPETDFIYAAIVEEMGLIGAAVLLMCFAFLFWRVAKILQDSHNNFARLVAAGFLVMLTSQTFVNMGMTIGITPITGIPLPFVSYGGSGMIALFAMLGILQSIKINK